MRHFTEKNARDILAGGNARDLACLNKLALSRKRHKKHKD